MQNQIAVATPPSPEFEDATFRKIARRLIPFIFLCYIFSFLDRVNVGFAKLQMAGDLQFSDQVYGFGAGIFFIGYFIFEVPSNVILERVGARLWIARIMITWGIISSAFLFTGNIHWGAIASWFHCTDAQFTFYFLRFLLGVAEAGFFPGIILCLTYWFPAKYRCRRLTRHLVHEPVLVAGNQLQASAKPLVLGLKSFGFQCIPSWQVTHSGTSSAFSRHPAKHSQPGY